MRLYSIICSVILTQPHHQAHIIGVRSTTDSPNNTLRICFETTHCNVCAGRTPGMRTSLTNLLMKINLKCGGRNYRLSYEQDHPARFASIGQKRTCIFFGADVSHPSSPRDRGMPSMAAVVASNDWPDSGRFIARHRQQKQCVEIICDLQAIVVELLNEWKLANQNRLPDVLKTAHFYSPHAN